MTRKPFKNVGRKQLHFLMQNVVTWKPKKLFGLITNNTF